ncbi:asparagine synthase (glutamine-hydrolyzing) [soil metagenome]
MCGIAGIVNRNNPVADLAIQLLSHAIQHRGPDGEGVWKSNDDSIALIHRRLSILDLTNGGSQPMFSSDKRFVIVFNGEIYNFIEVRNELKKKGVAFKTESDTEVILAAFSVWKEDMLSRFNGMWAMVIYDQHEKKLFLSRDRFGIKPLYYFLDENHFVFASEVQAIHQYLGNKAEPDDVVIADLAKASFAFHGTERTYLKNVYSLPGGFNLTLENGKVKVEKWYQLSLRNVPESFVEQAVELRTLLVDACKLRLRSDVPVATCLSGGVDSGSIVSLIHSTHIDRGDERFKHYSHQSFLASFPGTAIDERKEAEKLAGQVGNELKILDVTSPSVSELEEAMKACDGPMHALAFYPIWKLYKFIKGNGIKVTMDGQGPDEMMGGYRPLRFALEAAIKKKNFRWARDVYNTYAAQGEYEHFSSKDFARQTLKQLGKDRIKRFISGGKNKSLYNFHPLLQPVRDEKIFQNALDENQYYEFFYSPLPAILQQFDRCSMASGVECRMPFMDYRVVEFIFSLPPESKVGSGYTKRVLREAMKNILPESTRLNKHKIGFNAPVVDWFKGELREFMSDTINSQSFALSQYFDGIQIRSRFDGFLKNERPNFEEAFSFWAPVHIEWWKSKFKN